MFFTRASEVSCKATALSWKKGRGAAAHLNLKRHAQKQHVSASTQNRLFLLHHNKLS